MNKLLTKIVGLSLGLSMAIGVGVAASYSGKDAVETKAATVEFIPSDFSTTAGQQNVSHDAIDVAISNGIYNSNNNDFRVYKNATLTVSSSSATISEIAFTFTQTGLTLTSGGGTFSSNTWTGSSSEIVFTASAQQARITSMIVTYVAGSSSSLSVSTNTLIVPLSSTGTFDVNYANLSSNFSISSSDVDEDYISLSYTPASGTGSSTVTVSGLQTTTSAVTLTVSATGVSDVTVTVTVEKLPLINSNLNSFTWNHSSYATSPHLLTYKERYDFILSSGQLNSSTAYLGSNATAQTQVSLDTWTLKGTTIASAIDSWSTYGSAFYMSNFGIIHPTSFKINAGTVGSIGATRNYYILASIDSGETWTIKASGTVAAETDMGWSGSDYASTSSAVQFAFVMSYSGNKTISNITVYADGDSLVTTKVLDSIYVEGTPNTNCNVGVPYDIGANAVVKAHYTDSVSYPDENVTSQVSWTSIEHDSTSVTGTYNSKTVTINITPVSEGSIYKKIRGTNELLVGSYVVIGRSDSKYVAGSQATNNRNANNSDSFGYYDDGDLENYSFSTAVFEIGTTENGYTFYDTSANGYLYAASSSNNYLKTKSEIDANGNSEWSITFDSEGVATIVAQGDHTHNSMNISSSGNIVFGAYLSDEEFASNVSLFVNVEHNVQLFVDGYMHMTDPDYEGEGTGLCKSAGTYLAAKEAIISLGDVYIDEFESNSAFADAYLRYTKWAIANGDTSPFEGTGIVSAGSIGGIFGAIDDNIATIIIIVVSAVAITSIGALLVLKKRKEQF